MIAVEEIDNFLSDYPGQPHTFLNKREYISQQSAKAKQ
jgi:hypothetical protein